LLTRLLSGLRDGLLSAGLALVLAFPMAPVVWALAGWAFPSLPGSHPLLSVVFEAWDAGAQQPMSRALLRCLCALVGLAGLLLPARRDWRRPAWLLAGTIFLALGALSSVLAPHAFQALREWETWLAAGLLAYALAANWGQSMERLCLVCAYLLAGLAVLHSLSLGIPQSMERLGGPLHNPNAFSTLLLMLLAVLVPRITAGERDRLLAPLAVGALVGLDLCTGSLTGGALAAGLALALALAPRHASMPARVAAGLVGAALVVAANLYGGWLAVAFLPLALLLAWGLACLSRPAFGRASVAAVFVAGLLLCTHAMLAPPRALGQGSVSRAPSGLGRLEFYRCTLQMIARHPLLGAGPAGFSRVYPSRQSSIAYFSRFPHCLPLEVASEWGLGAALALALLLAGALGEAARPRCGPVQRAAAWTLVVFALHSLTDVQTQFPYLLVLAAVALAALAASPLARDSDAGALEPSSQEHREGVPALLCRVLLAFLCLAVLLLNVARVRAGFDRTLASAIAQRATSERSRQVVLALLQTSFQADPLNSESARLWALALLEGGQDQAAAGVARLAWQLDPHRASCLLALFTASPPPRQTAVQSYRAASEVDRINYPVFYRLWAEALRGEGRASEALAVLRAQVPSYSPTVMANLPEFRAADLSDQLVELYALKAVLEAEVRPGGAASEPDLRRALYHCDGSRPRLRRLRAYMASLGGSGPETLAAKLELLLHQVEGEQRPGAVEAPLHQP
jgi:hypothetical protein